MKTEILTDNLPRAAEIIRKGGLVAVPTETVYGLAGNGLDESAVEAIYEVKNRPAVKPLSLMVPGPEALERYGRNIPKAAYTLARCFWPGPLTIVVEAKQEIPGIVRAGGSTIGLRCPDHEKTLGLLRMADRPLAAPSANPSGFPSPKTAQQVKNYFDGKIDAILDGGPCGIGRESTIVSVAEKPYRILRQGALPAAAIRRALAADLKVIGIIGGSGVGKTTALSSLMDLGTYGIDCDALYHQMLEEDAELLSALKGAFPETVRGGKLDRGALGSLVFSKPVEPSELEPGDVIVFYNANHNDTPVTHRVVENHVADGEIVTKGDANTGNDLSPAPYERIEGKVSFHIPRIGYLVGPFGTVLGKISAVMFIAAGYLLTMIGDNISKKRPERDRA